MQSPFRRARAKRAAGAELDGLKPTAMIDETVRGYLSHGLLGVAIGALGLAVAGGVALTGSAQATEVSTQSTSMMAGTAQRAEPLPQAQDVDRETQAERQAQDAPHNAEDGESSDGTLDRYNRDGGTSRTNAVRAELQRGVSQQIAKERTSSLEDKGEQVSQTSRTAVQKSRSEQIAEQRKAIQAEQQRLEEEKRRKEEEARRKADERKQGTLTKSSAPVEGYSAPVYSGEATGAGGAKPIARYTIAARWGQVGAWSRYHTGIDLSAPIGTPVMAAADGTVKAPNGGGWAGVHVVIQHGGDATLYAHLNQATVRPGQTVKAGQVIGFVGMTGRTFGPHLHFEYYPSAGGTSNPYSTSDPYSWMLTKGVRL
ncbi:M23 family metallopeptidase [Enemella sp. A6]|uniref:M23 family metallopeptidase n=1 Tax=Enemella sp. A6 TaxID=3440152 RepID=UPI003EBAC5E2